MRVIGVFNRDGGTFRTMDLESFAARAVASFAAHGHQLEPRLVAGKDLLEALESAAEDADMLLAGGGDGTVSAAASVAYRKNIPLAVLPAGTMNLFARSLQIPLDLEEALEALAAGVSRDVDIATADDRPFVHQFSVGVHAKLVKLRETLTYRSRVGKIIASGRAIFGAILRPPNFRVDLNTARGTERRMAAGISVSNNPLGEGHIPHADRLDAGVLGIYIAKPMSSWALARLSIGVIIGRWKNAPSVVAHEAREISVSFPRRKSTSVAVIDGELIRLAAQVKIKIHPGALKVIVPAGAVPTGSQPDADLAEK